MITDLNGKNINYNTIKNGSITDVEYSPKYKDKLIVTINNTPYLVDPSAFGEEIQNAVSDLYSNYTNAEMEDTRKDAIYIQLSRLIDMINAYNPVAPQTSSDAGI